MAERNEIVDRFILAFGESKAGETILAATHFAATHGYKFEGTELRSAVAQSFRELEKAGLIQITKGR